VSLVAAKDFAPIQMMKLKCDINKLQSLIQDERYLDPGAIPGTSTINTLGSFVIAHETEQGASRGVTQNNTSHAEPSVFMMGVK